MAKKINYKKMLNNILDRSIKIGPVCEQVLSLWDFDLSDKKTKTVYDIKNKKVVAQEEELDLCTFLFSLRNRNAVITIPKYKSRRPKSLKSNEIVLSPKNRNGEIINLTSNKKTFSFGVMIKDKNVLKIDGESNTGIRTFLITDLNGEFYDGWKSIQVNPTENENLWFKDIVFPNKINQNTIQFKYFINPDKWIYLYTCDYLITKVLIERLNEQLKYMKDVMDDMVKNGCKYIFVSNNRKTPKPIRLKEKGKVERILSFQVKLDEINFNEQYPKINYSDDMLTALHHKYKELKRYLTYANFITRCVDFAGRDISKTPSDTFTWKRVKEKRTNWFRLFHYYKKQWNLAALKCRWLESSQRVKDVKEQI
jgi:hypothetical protein